MPEVVAENDIRVNYAADYSEHSQSHLPHPRDNTLGVVEFYNCVLVCPIFSPTSNCVIEARMVHWLLLLLCEVFKFKNVCAVT